MDDCISRQSVLEILDYAWDECGWDCEYGWVKEKVINLPSAQPERMKGKWIDAEWVNINTGEIRKGRRCSACRCGYFRYDVSVNTVSDIPNFCPNCGADMREGEQDERY